jgi:tetratricopeptide (TPR) repeat protein
MPFQNTHARPTGGLHAGPLVSKISKVGLTLSLCFFMASTTARPQRVQKLPEGIRALYRGDFKTAIEVGRVLAKAQPAAAGPRVLIARAEVAQGNLQTAFDELRQALRLDAANQEALHFLGHVCAILSQSENQKLFRMAPDSARVHQIMGESYRAQENTSKAEEEYLAALKANPNLVEVLNIMGDLKRYQFRFEEAVSYYSRAVKVTPRDYDSQYGLGASHLYLQQPELAIQNFQNALSIAPKSAAAHLAMGDTLLRLNRPEAAAEHLKTAIQIEPKFRQAYTLLGRSYQKLGKQLEAKEAFRISQSLIQDELESKAR